VKKLFFFFRVGLNLGWLDKNAVDKIENKQTHKVEGYFMSSDTSVSQGKIFHAMAMLYHISPTAFNHDQVALSTLKYR
jgi:hypothetical protein